MYVNKERVCLALSSGYTLTFNMVASVPMFWLRNLTLNQYLGYWTTIEIKIQYFGSRNLKERLNHAAKVNFVKQMILFC